MVFEPLLLASGQNVEARDDWHGQAGRGVVGFLDGHAESVSRKTGTLPATEGARVLDLVIGEKRAYY
jgi:prepilin-type processing-associated H-X9-DG protein